MNNQDVLRVLYSRSEIESAVKRLASEITRDYAEKNPLLIGILKGSFMFMSDLVRKLDFPLEIDFVRLSSYGSGRVSSGKVREEDGLRASIEKRHVLIVEDIIDSGITVNFLINLLKKKNPASLRLCALTDKPSRRKAPVNIDYLGLTVPDKFLVGYGLDCDEKYRNLPDICTMEDDKDCRITG